MTLTELLSIHPFSWQSIGAALLCGSIIGLERQLRGKPVGIRTSSLIVLGTYMFVAISAFVINDASDPSRIIGQVVTGVGFLGAGVMMTREGVVTGVTSAATIWALAALGVCVAVIDSIVAIKLSVLVVAILYGIDAVEGYSAHLSRGVHAKYSKWRRHK